MLSMGFTAVQGALPIMVQPNAGLPVLTCAGETFASRVAGSLLTAAGLPELVTYSLPDYESLALQLARDPARLQALRRRLEQTRLQTPLFDIAALTREAMMSWGLSSISVSLHRVQALPLHTGDDNVKGGPVASTDPNTQVKEIIGSGPFTFRLNEWKPGDKAVFDRNPNYKPRPEPPDGLAGGKVVKVDRVELVSVPDEPPESGGT